MSLPDPAKRLLVAAAMAVAAFAAPAAMVTINPATAQAACSDGEEEDQFTATCTPFLVPNSPSSEGFTTTAANPDIPEIDGVPCTGRNSGECIGLAEDQVPVVTPHVTISSSP